MNKQEERLSEQILRMHILLKDLNRQLEFAKEKGKRASLLKSIHNNIKESTRKQYLLIDKLLFLTNTEYNRLALNNYKLLQTEKIRFSVGEEIYNGISSYAKEFKGKLNRNGLSFTYANKSNMAILPFSQYIYPKELRGRIDHLGYLHLKTVKTGMALFKNLPGVFEGSVNEQGIIRLSCTEKDYDILSGGSRVITKLMAMHFNKNSNSLQAFHQNKSILIRHIQEYARQL